MKTLHRLTKAKPQMAELMNTLERTSHSARKARTRKLIALGGLVAKAKLDGWNTNALLGGLLSLKNKEADQLQIEAWIYKGDRAFRKRIRPPNPLI